MQTSDVDNRLGPALPAALSEYVRSASTVASVSRMHLFGTGDVAEFEARIAHHFGMKHALCMPNATTGLLAVALALDLAGSEFVTGAYGYGASLASWLMLGGKPIFADIDKVTLTLDPAKARSLITAKTRSILTADVFGNPSDICELRKLADDHAVPLIADCSQSLGATRNGLPAGCGADAVVISFTAGKTVFAGEGGAVVTDDSEIYDKLIYYTQHPHRQKRELGLRISNEFAFNGRIHPLAAIWGNAAFAQSLENLKGHQAACLGVINVLNETGLIQPVDLAAKEIMPSFFELTVDLNEGVRRNDVANRRSQTGRLIRTFPAPASVIYQNPAFQAQFSRRYCLPAPCLVAERQARNRVAIAFSDNGRSS